MWPVNSILVQEQEQLAAMFRAESPLPGLAVVSSFFSDDAVGVLVGALDEIEFSRYCVWSPTNSGDDLRSAFQDPDFRFAHLSIHARPETLDNETFLRTAMALGSPPVLEWLGIISGKKISYLDPRHVLTRWGPGDFLGPHLDAGSAAEPVALVLSISLTQGWRREWGGETIFEWEGNQTRLTSYPKANQTIIFAPHQGSYHWVEPVAETAPPDVRHTWTLHYR
ncbi:MAG: 2OG-Fe(II) oxygenase [Candidatus Thiosymbion ectosymbiont of Robbea hypermnestra]|nr:2OG-Fe(II) oxygenase [Candidatus Thiosymbion ectosymbiont of Robbea hypermnestra]